MLDTRPDFFIHCGDTIYADIEIEESVVEDTGETWRNVVGEGVHKVAETLDEFRGRHRYPLLDANVRALYAEVPTISQWDDHETLNNWYPGEVIDDDRYVERRCDVLSARGRRAWQEYQPVPVQRLVDRGSRRLRVRADLPQGPARHPSRRVLPRHALLPRPQPALSAGRASPACSARSRSAG